MWDREKLKTLKFSWWLFSECALASNNMTWQAFAKITRTETATGATWLATGAAPSKNGWRRGCYCSNRIEQKVNSVALNQQSHAHNVICSRSTPGKQNDLLLRQPEPNHSFIAWLQVALVIKSVTCCERWRFSFAPSPTSSRPSAFSLCT